MPSHQDRVRQNYCVHQNAVNPDGLTFTCILCGKTIDKYGKVIKVDGTTQKDNLARKINSNTKSTEGNRTINS